jgi:hypothetical protein
MILGHFQEGRRLRILEDVHHVQQVIITKDNRRVMGVLRVPRFLR